MPKTTDATNENLTPPPKKRGRGPRHPFKAKRKQDQGRINGEISKILNDIDKMLFKIARDILPEEVDSDTVHEVVQRCRIWLWQKSLPRYDAWRGVKVSTFVFTCAGNFIRQEKRAMLRKVKNVELLPDGDIEPLTSLREADRTMDRKIEQLSRDIIENPEQHMTPAQSAVFSSMLDNSQMMMKTLANKLGYRRPSSLSMIKRRIRERLTSIPIEDYESKKE